MRRLTGSLISVFDDTDSEVTSFSCTSSAISTAGLFFDGQKFLII
jgi:hypothetical protein